jgi:hypothetical protein
VLAANIATFRESMTGQDIGPSVEPDDDDALHAAVAAICGQLDAAHAYRFDDYLRVNSWATNARLTADVYAKLLSNG